MKRWISPPVQLFLWLGGIACLSAAAWNLWELRQVTVAQHMSQQNVSVALPDAKALAVPGIGSYRKLVDAPLFWAERAVPKKIVPTPPPPVAVQEPEPEPTPEVVEVPLDPPLGRLVGIVDLGDKMYALVRSETENKSLYKGDEWEGWKVDSIDADKVVLSVGKQTTEVPLIGDFEAPKANKQLLAAKQRRQHRKRQQKMRQQNQQQQAARRQQALAAANNSAAAASVKDLMATQAQGAARSELTQALGGNAQQNIEQGQQKKPTPVLSIKEALEARQRLMSSRWGNSKKEEGQ